MTKANNLTQAKGRQNSDSVILMTSNSVCTAKRPLFETIYFYQAQKKKYFYFVLMWGVNALASRAKCQFPAVKKMTPVFIKKCVKKMTIGVLALSIL